MQSFKVCPLAYVCVLGVFLALVAPVESATVTCTKTNKKCQITYDLEEGAQEATTVQIDYAIGNNANNILLIYLGSTGEDPLSLEEILLDPLIAEANSASAGSASVELEFICTPSTVADQRLKRQQSLEKGNTGNDLKTGWWIFTTTCGTILTKTAEQLKACTGQLQFQSDASAVEGFSSIVTFSTMFTNECTGTDKNLYVQASTTAGMPFHIVRCNGYQTRPFLVIGGSTFQNDEPLYFKPAGSGSNVPGNPLELTPKYYAGVSCVSVSIKKFKLEGENYKPFNEAANHQVAITVNLGNDANNLIYGVNGMDDDEIPFIDYTTLLNAALKRRRLLSLVL